MADGRDETPVNEQPDETRDPEIANDATAQVDETEVTEETDESATFADTEADSETAAAIQDGEDGTDNDSDIDDGTLIVKDADADAVADSPDERVSDERALGVDETQMPAQDELQPTAKRSVAPIPILSTPPANPLAPLSEQDAVNQLYVETDPPLDSQIPGAAVAAETLPASPTTETSENLAAPSAAETTNATETSPTSQTVNADETTELGQVTQPKSIPTQQAPSTPAISSGSQEPRAPFLTPQGKSTPSGPEKVSPLNEFEQEKSGRGWLKGLVATVVTLVVLGGAYAGAQYLFADKVAKAVTVAGVDIGGLTQSEAVAKLDKQLSPALSRDMALSAGELSTVLVPNKAGVSFDAQQTVAGTTGFSWDPTRLWTHLVGGEPIEPAITVDDTVFAQSIESVASSLLVEPINGTVSFVDGQAVATAAEDGSKVDVTTAKEKVVSNLFTTTRPIALTTETTEPEITQAKTDEAFAQAQKIASAAVTVKVGDTKVEVPSRDFTKHIVVDAADGSFSFSYSGEDLVDEVLKRTQNLLTEAKDARFEFKNGKPVIIPGTAGTTIDPEALVTAFSQAALADTRVAEIELTEADPEQSTEALEKLGVKELVASFSTPLPGGTLRTENLRVAASRVTGTLVKPGEEFDLTKVIGPISKANGYHDAGVIVNGIHTEGVGGGLSQMSTTAYNAGFFAGMTDIAHRPHSVWFQRYPAGRESTLFVGSINMVWRNDSPTGILMRSYVANGKVTVEAWGTKTYEVTTTTSPHRNIVKAQVTTSTAPDCVAYGKGEDGFTVTVTRKVREIATGKLVKDEAKTWTYRPDNGVTCKKKETPKPSTTQDAATED